MKKLLSLFFVGLAFAPHILFAHEVYVLSPHEAHMGLLDSSVNIFQALSNSSNLRTFTIISFSILAVLILYFFFQRTRVARHASRYIEKLHVVGPFLLRLAVGVSLFYSAESFSFLGPELSLHPLPFTFILRFLLYVVSIMTVIGLFTEIAAFFGLIVFALATFTYGHYMFTYFTYVAEFVALIIFGSRSFSIDKYLFGEHRKPQLKENIETLMIRVSYGFSLIYAAVNVKIFHAILTLDVVKEYNLTRFHLLFPHDPLLLVLGAALAEITIGFFIMVGFELRLTVLISLFYITLSLLFFKELVWPHYILFGTSLNLLFAPQKYTLDGFISKKWRKWRGYSQTMH